MDAEISVIDRAIEQRKQEIEALEKAREILAGSGLASSNGRATAQKQTPAKVAPKKPPTTVKPSKPLFNANNTLGPEVLALIATRPRTFVEISDAMEKKVATSASLYYPLDKLKGINFIAKEGDTYVIRPAGKAWLDEQSA